MHRKDVKKIHDLINGAIDQLREIRDSFSIDTFGEEPALYWDDVATVFSNLDREGKKIVGDDEDE